MCDGKRVVTVFHADLDNTLIYSYRRDIGRAKINVERYEGREISFMTEKSYALLKKVREHVVFVPTTTRTEAQYQRIDLKTGVPDYALVCNGGVLLKGEEEVPGWYADSLGLIEKSRGEFEKAWKCMQEDRDRIFEVRNIRNLFLFTKSGFPSATVERMKRKLDDSLMSVFCNGSKVYAVPEGLDKGAAVRRFREYIKAGAVIAAGDSEFDIPMLKEADQAYAPASLSGMYCAGAHVTEIPEKFLFSDALLSHILSKLSGTGCPAEEKV